MMQENKLNVRVLNAYKTEADWVQINPVPLKGEICISSDLNNFKVGNGVDKWVDLPYILDSTNIDSAYQKTFDLTSPKDFGNLLTGDNLSYNADLRMYGFSGNLRIWVPNRVSDYAVNLIIGFRAGDGHITTPQLSYSISDNMTLKYQNVKEITLHSNIFLYLTRIQVLEVNLDIIPVKVSQLQNDLNFISTSVTNETLNLFIPIN